VLQNTFVGCQLSVFISEPDPANGGHVDNVFAGNAFLAPTEGQTYIPGGLDELDFHENAWFGGTTDAAGAGDVTADPQLGDITSGSPFDLRPGPSSPLIDAAPSSSLAEQDFMAQERPQGAAADIGAFEVIDAEATVVTVPLPPGVTDPIRVFTAWDWGDGSEVLTSIGVTSSHHFGAGSYEVVATVHDPVAGTDTVHTTSVPPSDGGGGVGAAGTGGTSAGGGGAVGAADAAAATEDSAGCGCRAAGSAPVGLGVWVVSLGVTLLVGHRRHRRGYARRLSVLPHQRSFERGAPVHS
jgi:hypothetical protein